MRTTATVLPVLAESATTPDGPAVLRFARGAVLESLWLWPTTLVVLREATRPVDWGARTFQAGTTFVDLDLDLVVDRGRYLAQDPLPATVDHLGLRFTARPGGTG